VLYESNSCPFSLSLGLCGACWAVSTAAAVESALMITNETDRYDEDNDNSLSFQQMISCDTKENGCLGGNIFQATRYVWEHNNFNNNNYGGLVLEEDWPYTDYFGKTTTTCEPPKSGVEPVAYLNYPQVVNSVNDRSNFGKRKDNLMYAVSKQPVTAVLKSKCDLLSNYKNGVLTHDSGCECCETACIDHAIVIVGYDTTGATPHWIVRNSWGKGWGEEGNFRIAMNDEGCGWGLFGLLAEASAPSQAYSTLEEVPERSWWMTSQKWEKALVIMFSILGFIGLCCCIITLWKRRRGSTT